MRVVGHEGRGWKEQGSQEPAVGWRWSQGRGLGKPQVVTAGSPGPGDLGGDFLRLHPSPGGSEGAPSQRRAPGAAEVHLGSTAIQVRWTRALEAPISRFVPHESNIWEWGEYSVGLNMGLNPGSTSSRLCHSVKRISLSEPRVLSWDRAWDVK